MTWAQWVFEARGLEKREEEQLEVAGKMIEASLRAGRLMLIRTLGLDLLPDERSKTDQTEKLDEAPFVPLSFLAGHPEIMKTYIERLQRKGPADPKEDEMFDQFSEQLLQQLKTGQSDIRGDMVPLLTDELKEIERNSYWHSEDVQRAMQTLGIKPRGSGRAVPHIDKRPKFMEDRLKEQQAGFISDEILEEAGELPSSGRKKVVIDEEVELEKFRRALGDDS
jgi:hypothetical protein